MSNAIAFRSDFSAAELRRLARKSDDADQTRRLLAIAVIVEGHSRSEAARTGGVGLQIIRDWVLRFNAGGPEALRTRRAPGKTPTLTDEHRERLAAAVEAGPKPYIDGVVRWRLIDLARWLEDECEVKVSPDTVGRELKALGYAKISARPQHFAQNELAQAEFKKTSPST